MEGILSVLQEYGIVGILLSYFLWKDSKVFEIFSKTMQEIVTELRSMREKQDKIILTQEAMDSELQELKDVIKHR